MKSGSDTTTIAEYEYYGDTRRSLKKVQNRGAENVPNDGGNTEIRFYYCGVAQPPSAVRWSICETRNGSDQTTFQHLWGPGGTGILPVGYIDELIWLEKNGDPTESNDTNPDDQTGESTADERYFVHQDRNWNIVALTEYDPNDTNNGRIVERYSYTPYGSFVVLKGDDGNGELCAASPTSTVGNVFAYQGLPYDHEKGSYQNRHWHYAAVRQGLAHQLRSSGTNAGAAYGGALPADWCASGHAPRAAAAKKRCKNGPEEVSGPVPETPHCECSKEPGDCTDADFRRVRRKVHGYYAMKAVCETIDCYCICVAAIEPQGSMQWETDPPPGECPSGHSYCCFKYTGVKRLGNCYCPCPDPPEPSEPKEPEGLR